MIGAETTGWFADATERCAEVIEALGLVVLMIGGTLAVVRWLLRVVRHEPSSIRQLRNDIGRVILLALEILVAADLILTVVVDRTLEAVAVLGILVVIRVLLSWSLEVDIDGAWPWRRRQILREEAEGQPSARADTVSK